MADTDNKPWPEWAEQVIEWLYSGRSLLAYCREDGTPGNRTIYDLRDRNPSFAAEFARAREAGATVLIDEAQDIADTPQAGEIVTEDPEKGRIVRTEDMLGHRKLQVDIRLKRAACFAPHIYGTRIQHGGDAGAPPIKVEQVGPVVPAIVDLAVGIDKLKDLRDELLGMGADEDAEDEDDTG